MSPPAPTRGAHAIGIDFAADMVAAARRRYPRIEFREGDAENLAFDPASFDAVVCAFGILHIADPDKAIAEAYRVLRPDGRFAFTVWAGPDRHDFFASVLKALEAHGNAQVSLPPAPPIFRFSDPAECRKAMTQAGFVDASVVELALKWRAPPIEAILDCIYKSTVRTSMVLERQAPAARDRIHEAIHDSAERFAQDGAYEIAWLAVLAAARKPRSQCSKIFRRRGKRSDLTSYSGTTSARPRRHVFGTMPTANRRSRAAAGHRSGRRANRRHSSRR